MPRFPDMGWNVGKNMGHSRIVKKIYRPILCILLSLICIGAEAYGLEVVGNGNSFQMVITKPKAPFLSVLIRDMSGLMDVKHLSIDIDSTLNQPIASIYINTNVENPYTLHMTCSPFQKTVLGEFCTLSYKLLIYDVLEDSPVDTYTIGKDGLKDIPLMEYYKSGTSEEKIEVATLAIQLLDSDSGIPGDPYQAAVYFEVRSI